MNRLAIIVPAALIFSGCTLVPKVQPPTTMDKTQQAEKLAQIVASGGQADCKITNLSDNSSTQMIVSGKKMKITGSNFGDGKSGTMINDTEYTYIWADGEKTGIKTKLQTMDKDQTNQEATETADTNQRQQVDNYENETKYQTDCVQRTVPDSEFTPPADVIFSDLSEIMKAIPTVPSLKK